MADDEGASVEAAASLFGEGEEAATDFFATTFDNLSSEDPKISDKTSLMHPSNVAENIFEAGPPGEDPSLFVPTSYETPRSGFGDDSVEDNPHSPNSQGPPQGSLGQDDGQSQGWQDGQGQWHDYNYHTSTYYPSQYESTGAYVPQDNYSSPLHDYAQRSTEYVPPIAQSRPPPASHFSDYSQRYAPQQPSQPLHSHQSTYVAPYAASQNTNYSGPIDSYSLTSPPTNQATVSNYAGDQAIPPQVAPTQRDVNAYRPTTLTAYDPPISRKNRSKGRSVLPDPSISQDHFNDVRPSHASAPFPPSPPPPSRIPQDATGHAPHPAPSQGYNPSQPGNAEWLQKHETVAASKVEVPDRYPAHQVSGEVWETSNLGERLNSQAAATSFRDGEFFSENPEVLAAREQGFSRDSEKTTSYDPEEAIGSVPLDKSVYTSASEPDYVYGLDDQPFADGGHAIQAPIHPVSPPRQTASPLSFASEATRGHPRSGVIRDKHSDDPYHPRNRSRTNSDASHLESTGSISHDRFDARGSSSVSAIALGEHAHDPYAPPSRFHSVQSRDNGFAFGSEHTSRYDYPCVPAGSGASSDLDTTTGSTHVLTAPTYTPYAPSPSLLGTNDPLGRATARVPVISFGFGGKLVSCFHSASDISGGFDISLTARRSTDVHMRVLHEVIPASAMDSSTLSYPGPLFFDPGAPSVSLARTVGVGVASNIKSKKMLVSQWLEERANDISKGVAFLPSGSQERFATEGRLVLVRLLKAMLDNDGQLTGSPTIEWAVRTALVPRLDSETPSSSVDGLSSTDLSTYSSPHADLNEAPLAVYQLRSSSLDRIQEFLLRGERHKAYHFALDQKLWGHAMLIASSIDNQAWKEVVKEFLHGELAVKQHSGSFPGLKVGPSGPSMNGRESLRVAYSLLAGHGAASVQELIPPRSMPATKPDSLFVPQRAAHATPVSPNFPQPALTSSVSPEALATWNETAAMMAFSQVPGDSAALTALGDYLVANRWFEAAHACYILSPRTSSFGGVRQPSVRLVLVGSESPSTLCNFSKDLDVTIFSEIVEFALSLSSSKGQDSFVGLPHLQPYKLVRAAHLAEMGHVDAANRYCEAIGSVIRASMRGSLFYTPTFIGELKNLSDRLTAAPQLDKTASWISSKLSKPSLDTIGSWLEGRFSKLIVGEGEGGQQAEENEQTSQSRTSYGPFSHYSNISSATTSASPSPSPTPYLSNGVDTVSRTPSVPFDGEYKNTLMQIDRASSAMDHLRPQVQRASPVQRVASASAATTTFAQAASLSTRNFSELGTMKDVPESEGDGETDGQEATWWGSNLLDKNGRTPTATTFYKVDEGQSKGNFVSLMDTYSPKNAISSPLRSQHAIKGEVKDEDEEDLGLGNITARTPKPDDKDSKPVSAAETPQKPAQEKPDSHPKTTSWFGRWWNRSSEPTAGSGPIKAKLGEESSFYYDKEQKRWVNKKAGTEVIASTPPPPPPSRPRTASPSPGGAPPPAKGSNGPHARPASAAELSMPPRKPPRARSNLIPTEEPVTPGSATSSTVSLDTPVSGLTPTPGGINRPKSSASKRNVRNRYVDILQQQGDS